MDRVCGNCSFGADAYDRYGNVDPQYVICQIKESENRRRKPDRFQTMSAVSRMHIQRESCLHWKPDPEKWAGESPLPMQSSNQPAAPTSLYDQMYGSAAPDPEQDWRPQSYAAPNSQGISPHHAGSYSGPSGNQAIHSAEQDAEIKRLKNLLMQQEQLSQSLQTQNILLAEENASLKETLSKTSQKLEQLKPFDVALFAEVNFYSLLGVKENASPEQIKEAYRSRMKLLHPDRFINISQRLNMAYETLMDAEKRRKYNQQIKGSP
ncbi:MAG: hypothetical protein CVV27_17920 [Candidatus Melainabacteria bacterium HGW-Melainabacteria-1]|nr:MAG: hypothetical protein CVV27_17920 [Candidatus Melainabacteria bacterium HGW-Melainabacteria-1]